jgi:cell division transport system ATP-binding protein
MINFERVSKRYEEGHDALREISVDIGRDELVFLTGHSGAGKSTLLRLIMLMERPTRGRITVDGRDLATVRRRGVPGHRRDIGVVFQNHQLLFDRPVFDNVALPLLIAGFDLREVGRRVRAALDKVGLLQKERAMPVTLSGGEQQRVGIARAVVGRPKILLADEPTGNLDPASKQRVVDLLLQQCAQIGTAVLMVTHDHSLIPRFDRHYSIDELLHSADSMAMDGTDGKA